MYIQSYPRGKLAPLQHALIISIFRYPYVIKPPHRRKIGREIYEIFLQSEKTFISLVLGEQSKFGKYTSFSLYKLKILLQFCFGSDLTWGNGAI